jgi:hypothetical protein
LICEKMRACTTRSESWTLDSPVKEFIRSSHGKLVPGASSSNPMWFRIFQRRQVDRYFVRETLHECKDSLTHSEKSIQTIEQICELQIGGFKKRRKTSRGFSVSWMFMGTGRTRYHQGSDCSSGRHDRSCYFHGG